MIKDAKLIKEIIVGSEDKIGVLANITKILADHDINIEGVAGYGQVGQAKIMLVTDDNLRAGDAIRKAGYKDVKECEALIVELENKPGALKNVTAKLVEQNINIKYTYGTICSGGCAAKIVLSTTNNEKAFVSFKKK
jgi:hypothetical protein